MFFESRAWKQIRAVLVLLHVIAIVLAAIPAPVGGLNRALWKLPGSQAEFVMWAGAIGMAPAEFEDKLYALATFWMNFRAGYLTPVEPYTRVTGTDQPWRMFVGPDRYPARFQLQYLPANATEFVTLFEERSSEFRWHESFFSQERLRSQTYRYALADYAFDSQRGCNYLAARVFEEKPDATQVRCRYFKQHSRSAEQVSANTPAEPGAWDPTYLVAR